MPRKNNGKAAARPGAARRPKRGRKQKKTRSLMQKSTAVVSKVRHGQPIKAASVSGNPYAKGGSVRIRHREYLGEVHGSDLSFEVTRYPINPGVQGTFPWLSTIAENFEQYKFHKLTFHYATERATFIDGYILQAIDYDPADPTPTTKQTLAMFQGATRGAIYDNVSFSADLRQLNKERLLYLRSGNLAPNLDIKTYDSGSYFIATGGTSDSINAGELWVDYDVELVAPQFDPLTRAIAQSAYQAFGPAILPSAAFRSTAGLAYEGGLQVRSTASGSGIIIDRVGEYLFVVTLHASSMTRVAPVISVGTDVNVAVITDSLDFRFNGAVILNPLVGDYIIVVRVKSVSEDETRAVDIDFTPSASGITRVGLRIVPAPYDMMNKSS